MGTANNTPSDEFDSPWKEILDRYFPQFMAFFFPDLYALIDWTAGYESLETELREVVRDAATGKRVIDKLVKVRTLSGQPLHVFVHLEIQADRDVEFPRRMFVYHYRLFDCYPEQVVSLAVLGDDHSGWRPERYEHDLWGNSVSFKFRAVKLWDYNSRWAELEADPNPFATVVMAHLQAKGTRGQVSSRLSWKLRLVRRLYERGYERQDVLELFRFIDWVLALPQELEQQFRREISKIEEEYRMPYVTSIERMGREEGLLEGIQKGLLEGIQKGRQEGRQEGRREGRHRGLQEALLRQSERRFGTLPTAFRQQIEQIDSEEQLYHLLDRILTATTRQDLGLG